MGRIVKAESLLPSPGSVQESAGAGGTAAPDPDCERAAAEVTRLLVSARVTAEAERAAAKDAALVLARKMAERIVGRAVALDPSILGEIAGQALAASRARGGSVVLRVHPDDLAAVEQTRPNWSQRVAAAADVSLVADESVGRNGCVVETPVGRLDARLQTQLDALERALRGAGLGRA
jgi:flagellar biosynthesis/type III secretory pathway protein FliH